MHSVSLVVAALLTAFVHPHTLQSDEMQQAVLASFLHLFGFKTRPRLRTDSNFQVPSPMLQLYKRQRRFASENSDTIHFPRRDTRNANTVRSFVHTETVDDTHLNNVYRFIYRFNLSDIPQSEHPTAAELRIYRHKLHNPKIFRQQIHVYDVLSLKTSDHLDEPILRLLDTRTVDVRQSGWEKLDVLPSVTRWRQKPNENYGILVKVRKVNSFEIPYEQHFRLKPNPQTENQFAPILLIFTDDGRQSSNSRIKRTVYGQQNRRRHRGKTRRNLCRRHPFYVDFSDVGWTDWIVAPPGYHAFYCRGECPFPLADHFNATNHAVIQNLVNSVKPSTIPPACCIPTELSSISMLYTNAQDEVILKNYDKMVVEGCGCR